MNRVFVDMMERKVEIQFPPKRIISVVPSQTELLYDLGLNENVIGITKFCIHPEQWFRNKPRIGGTKKLDIEKITALNPDLIIANKEENTKEQINALAERFPVWISDIQTVEDAVKMISEVGEITGKSQKADELVTGIEQNFRQLQRSSPVTRTAYFIWYNPWMSVGHDTFIHDIMQRAGFENVFTDQTRYPEISMELLIEANPQLVLLSSEPFPFRDKHVQEIKRALPDALVKLVDGEMFSWYGSRMLKATKYISELLQAIS